MQDFFKYNFNFDFEIIQLIFTLIFVLPTTNYLTYFLLLFKIKKKTIKIGPYFLHVDLLTVI